ncbi:MAG: hypothetical protein HZB38_10525 [Planctomycetes bacterium]|nr:hypothetical protein [Planctomycetota bacterium]
MGEVEERQDVLPNVRATGLVVGQAFADALHFDLDLGRLGGERILVDRAGQIPVQQPLLHLFELGQALARQPVLFFAHTVLIVACDGQVAAEPIAALVVGDAQRR